MLSPDILDWAWLYPRAFRHIRFVFIGFPSNDFANQEPGTEKSIKQFCRLTYNVHFPMYAKTKVIEDDVDAFYKALAEAAGQAPRWNFHKYLIDRGGILREASAAGSILRAPE